MNTLARNSTAPKPILPVQFNKIYISDPPDLKICNTVQMKRNPRPKLKTTPYGPPSYAQALVQLVQKRRLSPAAAAVAVKCDLYFRIVPLTFELAAGLHNSSSPTKRPTETRERKQSPKKSATTTYLDTAAAAAPSNCVINASSRRSSLSMWMSMSIFFFFTSSLLLESLLRGARRKFWRIGTHAGGWSKRVGQARAGQLQKKGYCG
jgi:hypothetical protein